MNVLLGPASAAKPVIKCWTAGTFLILRHKRNHLSKFLLKFPSARDKPIFATGATAKNWRKLPTTRTRGSSGSSRLRRIGSRWSLLLEFLRDLFDWQHLSFVCTRNMRELLHKAVFWKPCDPGPRDRHMKVTIGSRGAMLVEVEFSCDSKLSLLAILQFAAL